MIQIRRSPLVLASLLAAAFAATACHRDAERPAAPTAPAGPPVAVSTAPVTTLDASSDTVPAEIRSSSRATVAARIAATVVALPREIGERVGQGEVLARLDDTALRAALTAAEANLAAAATDEARAMRLLERGAATPRERDEAVARAAAARAAVSAARDALAYASLRAPFAGTITTRHVTVGDVAAPGQPLVTLEGGGAFELVASVDAVTRASLAVGDTLTATLADRPDPVTVTITAIASSADPGTHRFPIQASLALPPTGSPAGSTAAASAAAGAPSASAPALRGGVFARLAIPAADSSAADGGAAPGASAAPRLAVPVRALVERGGLTGVFVVAGDRASLRWVATGARHGDLVAIRAGVSAGEQVILDPGRLAEGALVTPTPAAATSTTSDAATAAEAVP